MEIETQHFEFAHGRRPSGRGSWAFLFTAKSQTDKWIIITEFAPANSFYADAVKWARARAKELNAARVAVGS